MIQANELRIGNWVKWPNETEPNEAQWCHEHWIGMYKQNYGYPEPIQLTEGWLVKFGFDCKENKSYANGAKSPVHFNIWTKGKLTYNTLQGLWWYYGILDLGPKYVHQLQNLYFALTGEELTIKEQQK